MISGRRLVVWCAFAVWQGGFVFYSAVVVPVGTDVLGSASLQGQITQPVTDWLNRLGGVWAALYLWDLLADPDPDRTRRRRRWAGWAVVVGLLVVLVGVHYQLDALLDPDGDRRDARAFRRWHVAYLWASTAQWAAAVWLGWLTVRAWAADPARLTPRG